MRSTVAASKMSALYSIVSRRPSVSISEAKRVKSNFELSAWWIEGSNEKLGSWMSQQGCVLERKHHLEEGRAVRVATGTEMGHQLLRRGGPGACKPRLLSGGHGEASSGTPGCPSRGRRA